MPGTLRIEVWLGALLAATLVACDGAPVPEYRAPLRGELRGANLILITVDTARRDHFSCYGVPGLEETTPAIDALAAEGALFLDAYSQTNVTNPSHVAIFTGLYALDARIMNNVTRFSSAASGVDTLPAAFRRAGYRTGGFAAVPHVSPAGLDLPGFDHSRRLRREYRAHRSVEDLLEWIGAGPSGRFFAWLHLYDPHTPYDPPRRFAKRFYEGDPEAGSSPSLGDVEAFRKSASAPVRRQFGAVRDRAYPRALYRSEVNFVDEAVGRLVRRLRRDGLYQHTGIVLIGDHGESLGEHDVYYGHAGLYEVSLRIPFIVRLPGFPAGVRVADPVGQIDLVPTLDYLFDLGMSAARARHGLSLADALRGAPDPRVGEREWLVHESAHNQYVALRRGGWKAIYPIWPPAPPLLFDLEEDPREEEDLAEAHQAMLEELQPLVQRWIDQGRWGLASPEVAEELGDQLRALGYLPSGE